MVGTSGRNELRFGAQRLQSAQAQWQLGLAPSDPLVLHLQLKQASWQGRTVAQAELQTQGLIEQHSLNLQAQLDALPPAWMDELQAGTTAHGTGMPRVHRTRDEQACRTGRGRNTNCSSNVACVARIIQKNDV